MGPVLATSDTNASADHLAQAASAAGLNAVRIGNPAAVCASPATPHAQRSTQACSTSAPRSASVPERQRAHVCGAQACPALTVPARVQVGPGARHLCVAAIAGRSPDGRKAQELRLQAEALMRDAQAKGERARAAALSPADEDEACHVRTRVAELRKRAAQLTTDATARVFANAHVVAGTCASTASYDLAGVRFGMVIVDEAAQATQASTLLPLVRGAECFVLAGDQMQLPPTLLSEEAQRMDMCTCVSPAAAALVLRA